MSGIEDALMSAAGALLSFTGTDTIPAIDFLEEFYGADSDKELIAMSVYATEHSVMSLNIEQEVAKLWNEDVSWLTPEGKESLESLDDAIRSKAEFNVFKRLITDVYPSGIISIVSDTFDFWGVLTRILPKLKDIILARDGKLVIRPDSGDPVHIICGDDDTPESFLTNEQKKGAFEILWDIFGGTINAKGFKELNPKIGLIYGDSITLERQHQILEKLEAKGFSAMGLVLGIGSYTYEYVTRDTYGFAMKATWGVVDDIPYEIFKNPKTDTGFKKSAKGLLQVIEVDREFILKDQVTPKEEESGELVTIFEDGKIVKEYTLTEIKERLNSYL